MAYSAEVGRGNPTSFVFLLDQSGSMADQFGNEHSQRKADFLADVVNRTLHDLVIRCTKTEEVAPRRPSRRCVPRAYVVTSTSDALR